jgi:hypothetical protein
LKELDPEENDPVAHAGAFFYCPTDSPQSPEALEQPLRGLRERIRNQEDGFLEGRIRSAKGDES